jgi:hypothetical protein
VSGLAVPTIWGFAVDESNDMISATC